MIGMKPDTMLVPSTADEGGMFVDPCCRPSGAVFPPLPKVT